MSGCAAAFRQGTAHTAPWQAGPGLGPPAPQPAAAARAHQAGHAVAQRILHLQGTFRLLPTPCTSQQQPTPPRPCQQGPAALRQGKAGRRAGRVCRVVRGWLAGRRQGLHPLAMRRTHASSSAAYSCSSASTSPESAPLALQQGARRGSGRASRAGRAAKCAWNECPGWPQPQRPAAGSRRAWAGAFRALGQPEGWGWAACVACMLARRRRRPPPPCPRLTRGTQSGRWRCGSP